MHKRNVSVINAFNMQQQLTSMLAKRVFATTSRQSTQKILRSITAARARTRLALEASHLSRPTSGTLQSTRNSSLSSKMQSPDNNDDFKLENLFNVKNKVAVVSGGGSGIGLMATQGRFTALLWLARWFMSLKGLCVVLMF